MPDGEDRRLWEEWRKWLVYNMPDDYALLEYLYDYCDKGMIDEEQVKATFDYVIHEWGMGQRQKVEKGGEGRLPGGQTAEEFYTRWVAEGKTAEEIYNRWLAAGQPKLPVEYWEWLQEALARERGEAEIAAQRGLEPPPPAPLPPVPEPYLGERWTPAAKGYEEKRAEAWFKQQQAAEAEAMAASAEATSSSSWEISPLAYRLAEEVGISPQEARRLGVGYFTGGGGIVREDELEQLRNKPIEVQRRLYDIGFEDVRRMQANLRQRREVVKPFVPPLHAELEVPGTPSWKDWFERQYGAIALKYVAKPFEERRPETWAGFLKGQEAETREEWWQRGHWARGERPQVFQPPIRTTRF